VFVPVLVFRLDGTRMVVLVRVVLVRVVLVRGVPVRLVIVLSARSMMRVLGLLVGIRRRTH